MQASAAEAAVGDGSRQHQHAGAFRRAGAAPLGFPIYTTTVVAPDPATNALGLITSNGIRGLVNGF